MSYSSTSCDDGLLVSHLPSLWIARCIRHSDEGASQTETSTLRSSPPNIRTDAPSRQRAHVCSRRPLASLACRAVRASVVAEV